MSPLQTVLQILPTLSVPELEEVKSKAQAGLALSPGVPATAAASTEDWLLEGITQVLRSRGIILQGRTLLVDGKVKAGLIDVQGALLKAVGRPLKTVEKTALGRVTAEAMADMISNYAPLGPKIMLQHIPKATQALENSFPGYLASGMVGLLIQRVRTPTNGQAHQSDRR